MKKCHDMAWHREGGEEVDETLVEWKALDVRFLVSQIDYCSEM